MWTDQARKVLGEYIERMEREHRLFEEIGREEMFRRRDEFLLPVGVEVGTLFVDTRNFCAARARCGSTVRYCRKLHHFGATPNSIPEPCELC